jgi:hypothetical protein
MLQGAGVVMPFQLRSGFSFCCCGLPALRDQVSRLGPRHPNGISAGGFAGGSWSVGAMVKLVRRLGRES